MSLTWLDLIYLFVFPIGITQDVIFYEKIGLETTQHTCGTSDYLKSEIQ